MKVDLAGNVTCGGSGGLYILMRRQKLGRIVHAMPRHQHAFGGDDWKTLYFTAAAACSRSI